MTKIFQNFLKVPVYEMVSNLKILYIFVDIKFDFKHLIDCIYLNFPKGSKFAVVGTIQFVSSIQVILYLELIYF